MNRFEATWLGQVRRREDGIRDGRVLVACSGGGDSTALLAFLWAIRRNLGLELIVAHADHGLRAESEEDACFVRELCRELDLDLVEARLDVATHAQTAGLGVETAARELRWQWLRTEAASCQACAVATGHTLDDHTETILLRLARGGGIGALTPLAPRQDLRWSPLIQARREELRRYLIQRGLSWREDATNQEDFTPRNRWRKLLETIRREAPALDNHLWETHGQVQELWTLRNTQVASWKGSRWKLNGPAIHLQGPWQEPELRWTLEAAFRERGWPREADLLRDLAAWALPHLLRHGKKPKQWAGWQLLPEPSGWILHPIREMPAPSPVRLDSKGASQEEP